MSFSCKGCPTRAPGCHSQCEKYIAEKKAHEEKMDEYRKWKGIQLGLDQHEIKNVERVRKRMRKPSKYGGQ